MSRILGWERICILCLLSVSVLAPIFLVSYRLKTLTLDGTKEFIEDVSSIKYRAEVLELSGIEQEDGDDVQEPKQEVYKDGNSSVVNRVSYEDLKSIQSGIAGKRNASFEITGNNIVGKQQENQVQLKEGSSNAGKERKAEDEKEKQIKDQLVRAKAYLSFSVPASNSHLERELSLRTKDLERMLGDARKDSALSKSAVPRMRNMEVTLSKASRVYPDCSSMVKKLRAMMQSTEDQVQEQKDQLIFLTQLGGRTTPKGLHCLSMRLTAEFFTLQPDKKKLPNQQNFDDPKLFHFAVFSDNVLAAAVVVNSTVCNAMEPEKIVFHIVTDPLNFPGISMWFLLNPPGKATIQVLNIDEFQWWPKDYASLFEKQKSIDPRYSSPLNHLRFHLPAVFPRLDKILFLDHDVVVQRDLSSLWSLNMKLKVNGAVQTCQVGKSSYRRIVVAEEFDPSACTWAFGMNLFDLREWRHQDLSREYHRLLLKGHEKPLWKKAGSLPLGWLTFYNQTLPLQPNWHVLGLGYESGVNPEEIEGAAVVHYNGIMKPWLNIGMKKFKGYWNKYLNFNHSYLRRCNINR